MMLKLAWNNLLHKPLSSLLCWILISVSAGIISLLLILQEQFEKQFSGNINGIDMVIGAKGSPLQLILSAVYHVDAPTGNIKYEEAEKWMHHPFVEKAIPLAYGDSYRGYAIVGTTWDYLDKYKAVLAAGKLYEKDFEVVVGSSLAKKLQLGPGSSFYSTHGNDEHGEEHTDKPYTVTGVLKHSGSILDNLIISNIESTWQIHEHHDEDEQHGDGTEKEEGKEVTAVLLTFRNPMGNVLLPRIINEKTNMMAAVPAIQVNRLFMLFGTGIDTLKKMAWGIMFLSGLSVFVALFNSLKERKYELALMRTMGAGRNRLLLLVLLEGIVLCLAGIITGLLLSRLALWFIASGFEKDYYLNIRQWELQLPGEMYLVILTVGTGIMAAIIPAVKAWFINISKTLSDE